MKKTLKGTRWEEGERKGKRRGGGQDWRSVNEKTRGTKMSKLRKTGKEQVRDDETSLFCNAPEGVCLSRVFRCRTTCARPDNSLYPMTLPAAGRRTD